MKKSFFLFFFIVLASFTYLAINLDDLVERINLGDFAIKTCQSVTLKRIEQQGSDKYEAFLINKAKVALLKPLVHYKFQRNLDYICRCYSKYVENQTIWRIYGVAIGSIPLENATDIASELKTIIPSTFAVFPKNCHSNLLIEFDQFTNPDTSAR